jgi:hypothetical protein
MLSLIAALDLGGSRNVSKFIHAYGNPRTFNPAAAAYYSQFLQVHLASPVFGADVSLIARPHLRCEPQRYPLDRSTD